jgi:hypothetical protein
MRRSYNYLLAKAGSTDFCCIMGKEKSVLMQGFVRHERVFSSLPYSPLQATLPSRRYKKDV